MDYDCNTKKAKFIDSSTSIRETFSFADQQQVLNAIQIYCGDFYGSMLWNLYGEKASQYYRCWNTSVKMCWDLPRSTHVVFVEHLLSCGLQSIRQQILTRYVKFFRSLLSSPSKEVAVIARVVSRDASSNTGLNLLNIHLETRLNLKSSPMSKFHDVFFKPSIIEPADSWKLKLLEKYLKIRHDQNVACEDSSYIDKLIHSLCST